MFPAHVAHAAHVMPAHANFKHIMLTHVFFIHIMLAHVMFGSCQAHVSSCHAWLMLAHVMPLMPKIMLAHVMLLMLAHVLDSCQLMSCHATHVEILPSHAKIHVISCQNSWLPMPKLMFPHVMPIHAIFHGGSCLVPLAGSCFSCGATSCDSWHKFC